MRSRRRRKAIEALAATYEGIAADRVREAIVALAADEEEAVGLVRAARIDYRDVLWWEDQRRTGRRESPITPERVRELTERFGSRPPEPVIATGPPIDVVLVAGARSPELAKAVRAATGVGLADAVALIDRAPVRLLAGVQQDEADRVLVALAEAGGTAELR